MTPRVCSLVGCDGQVYARGWCNRHYQRWLKHGDPETVMRPNLMQRFWRKVGFTDRLSCWEWRGSKDRNGYGHLVGPSGRIEKAHRVSWQLAHGAIPEGLYVLHRCDNRACVNPNHLWLGTYRDNRLDCVAKGRHANNAKRGEAHYLTHLTNEDVIAMRKRWGEGQSQSALAREYNISASQVRKIVHYQRWAHVGREP